MFDTFFQPLFSDGFTVGNYLLCTVTSLALGALVALTSGFRSARSSKSFLLSLALLPPIVQTVIMMVNGSIGTGVAVMGAFSLVRFRSVPGSAREIVCIFLSMAVGLSSAVGYLGIAIVFTLLMCGALLLATLLGLRHDQESELELKITIPESLNYAHAFDDLFAQYTSHVALTRAKTTNMGSLYKLTYRLTMKNDDDEQSFINDLRCRNGNLEIALGQAAETREAL